MSLNHNQYAVLAITATLCLAGFYTIIDAGLSTTISGGFESASGDIESDDDTHVGGEDFDGDGLPDLLDALRGFGAAANSAHDDGDAAPAVRVALVGRPNARRRARRRFFPSRPAATPLTRGIASRRRASRRCSTRSRDPPRQRRRARPA